MEVIYFLVIAIPISILISKGVMRTITHPSSWEPCTYCIKCKEHYPQHSIIASVYTCPSCGRGTKLSGSFRLTEDGFEVIDSRTGNTVWKD